MDPSTAGREAEIEELLRHVGTVSLSPDILSSKWMKLVVNTMCLGPLAMMGLTLYEAIRVPGVRELIMRAGTEALSVGQSLGYTVQPIFGLRPDDVKDTNQQIGRASCREREC